MLSTLVAAPPRDSMRTIDDLLAGLSARPRYRVARTLEEVTASWRLVYNAYLAQGLIERNRWAFHVTPQMASPESATIQRVRDGRIEATISAVPDGPAGLPLDSVYAEELDALRRQGRRLIEIGQFAHDRQGPHQVENTDPGHPHAGREAVIMMQRVLIELTGYPVAYGLSRGSTDIVIGVHPRHARFYHRAWGLTQEGAVKSYPVVNDHPVVLLRLDWATTVQANPQPPAVAALLRNPVAEEFFDGRFGPSTLDLYQGSPSVGDYFDCKLNVLRKAG